VIPREGVESPEFLEPEYAKPVKNVIPREGVESTISTLTTVDTADARDPERGS